MDHLQQQQVRPESSHSTTSPTSSSSSSSSSLFQVYLRLRPPLQPQPQPQPQLQQQQQWLTVEPPSPTSTSASMTTVPTDTTATALYPDLPSSTPEPSDPSSTCSPPTHITLHPPSSATSSGTIARKRAVEKFGFTRVFEERRSQLDLFGGVNVPGIVDGVIGAGSGNGNGVGVSQGRDGLLATLGVTGSGKSHTILGSKSQRGLLQLSLDLMYRSLDRQVLHPSQQTSLLASLCATDPSEAQIFGAQTFLENVYGYGEYGSRAGTPMTTTTDPTFTPSVPKRRFPGRPAAALLQTPDISNIVVPVAAKTEYCILVSMYEVYNDRIFDLLSTSASNNATCNNNGAAKDRSRRRHLLFKPTEMSPDRKVVAGLKKVVCGTYEEALMVLEVGLQERRVAGTGSNSVSSRSHGFFCVEVKRRVRGGMSSAWSGTTLTIVDLAGSERARNAKTAGATLAEAGKINESLMYLGQCLQMQSDQSHDLNKPTLVPFRQCKLTELLFSNFFPNHHPNYQPSHPPQHRNPQKAIMIVTADPAGDFNATSQILRYSALAREVTVPRIPSVSSTILAGINMNGDSASRSPSGSSHSPRADDSMVDMAFSEIARLNEEVELLNLRLVEEENRRREAEDNWQKADERAENLEMDVRDECWAEMEDKMEDERRRWVAAWGEETDRNEEHLDRKLDILSQSIQIHEDPEDRDEYVSQLEKENETLLHKLQTLERELQCRSPTKKSSRMTAERQPPPKLPSLGPRQLNSDGLGLGSEVDGGAETGSPSFLNTLNGLSITGTPMPKAKPEYNSPAKALGSPTQAPNQTPGTAGKKMRKLTARKWDLMDESELEAYENS